MLYNALFLLSVLGVQTLTFVTWGLLLRLGLSWAKVSDVSMRKVVTATVIFALLDTLVIPFILTTQLMSIPLQLAGLLMSLAIIIVAPIFVVASTFKVSGLRAIQAWLPTILFSAPGILLIVLVYRPFVFETFVVPTNAMAPSILGTHWQGTCPQCGAPNYCSPRHEMQHSYDPLPMICDNFHVTSEEFPNETAYGGDRIAVAKFLTPQRWDLAVFEYPQDPTVSFVKRVVGLPGEEVVIQDGDIWINGVRQQLPASLEGLEYVSEIDGFYGEDMWGTAERPAVLGDGEYFVLGDFSAQSHDSRLWREGAPGHPSYAVPKSHMIGVVTTTYWPQNRWRAHK
ncbi:MAG: signal peptidase I [Planctomycetaceae bacterium]